ncbi:unnamed protein product [Meganyctiphanes norvegica]|uniref:Uncharacterized protein n=1 Tax=Meganyctiphanes norvegica TaxID=48144 RepID=A0AAV2PLS0_MEGNR
MHALVYLSALLCLASAASAETLEEEGRLVFLDGSGTPYINTTTIGYGLLMIVPIVLVGLLVAAALGLNLDNLFGRRSDQFNKQPYYDQDYYYQYAQRSMETLSPILEMLKEAYNKWE